MAVVVVVGLSVAVAADNTDDVVQAGAEDIFDDAGRADGDDFSKLLSTIKVNMRARCFCNPYSHFWSCYFVGKWCWSSLGNSAVNDF